MMLSGSECLAMSSLTLSVIAARRLFRSGLALSVCFAATSPRGRGTGVSVRPTRDE